MAEIIALDQKDLLPMVELLAIKVIHLFHRSVGMVALTRLDQWLIWIGHLGGLSYQ